MGDRGNVRLEYGKNYQPIFIYSHWAGTFLPLMVAEALDSKPARSRWSDPSYCARIIFNALTKDADPELSWGLAPYRPDQEHEDVVINLEAKTVDNVPYEEFISYARKRYAEYSEYVTKLGSI